MSQLLAGHTRAVRLFVAAALLSALGCRATPTSNKGSAAPTGGDLVATVRTEPRNFARFGARESTTDLVALLLHAGLVRINRVTDEVEPWLAESWTRAADGLHYTIKLRPGVKFSDGHPLTSDDVVFSFEAAYSAGQGDTMQIDGRPIAAAPVDPLTVALTFPGPFAPGLRLLDNLIVLPRHKLGAALKNGTLARAWGPSTPPAEIVGLGPFTLTAYQPGERLEFARNPNYWRRDASGGRLPHLDRVTLDVVPEQNTELLRLEAGQSDAMASEVPSEAYASLKRGAESGTLRLYDLGPALYPDFLSFNLKPGAFAGDPRASWLQRDELRQAISLAVDRQLFVDTVFLGAGVPMYGPVSPANKKWYWTRTPVTPHDPARARALLASIGITPDHPARFTILTMKGRPTFERAVAVIRDELKKVGVDVDVVALEGNAVIQQIFSGKYDAVYFNFFLSDTDPAMSKDYWMSSGSEHFWNLEQKTPATEWERRIDDQIRALTITDDPAGRKRQFDEVQRIFIEHQPMIYFAAPRIFVGSSTRLGNVTPAVSRPQLLWSPDTLTVTPR